MIKSVQVTIESLFLYLVDWTKCVWFMCMTVGYAILGIEITRGGHCFVKKSIVLSFGMSLHGAVSCLVTANLASGRFVVLCYKELESA